jgi:hypothetical protein
MTCGNKSHIIGGVFLRARFKRLLEVSNVERRPRFALIFQDIN